MSNTDKYEFTYDSPFNDPSLPFVAEEDGWKATPVPDKKYQYNMYHQEKKIYMTNELVLVHRLVHESWRSYPGFAVNSDYKQRYGRTWTKVGVATSDMGNSSVEEKAAIEVLEDWLKESSLGNDVDWYIFGARPRSWGILSLQLRALSEDGTEITDVFRWWCNSHIVEYCLDNGLFSLPDALYDGIKIEPPKDNLYSDFDNFETQIEEKVSHMQYDALRESADRVYAPELDKFWTHEIPDSPYFLGTLLTWLNFVEECDGHDSTTLEDRDKNYSFWFGPIIGALMDVLVPYDKWMGEEYPYEESLLDQWKAFYNLCEQLKDSNAILKMNLCHALTKVNLPKMKSEFKRP